MSTISPCCTICHDITSTAFFPPLHNNTSPHWTQLSFLLGGLELNQPYCATCYAQVYNLLDVIRRLELIQAELNLGVAAVKAKIEKGRDATHFFDVDDVSFDASSPSGTLAPSPRRKKPGRKVNDEEVIVSKKPRKQHRRLTDEEKAVMLQKRKEADFEILGPFGETEDGRKFYEGYEVIMVDGFYTCVTCGFKENLEKPHWRKTRVMKVHIRSEHLEAYRCHPCAKNFATLRGMAQHNCPHNRKEKLVGECSICGKPVPGEMAAHLWTHKNQEEKDIATANGELPTFTCDKCLKIYSSRASLADHKYKEWKRLQNISNPPTVPCSTCGRKVSKCNLRRHESTHEGVQERENVGQRPKSRKKVPCPTCGRSVQVHRLPGHEWTHKNVEERETAGRLGQAPKHKIFPKKECPICGKPLHPYYLPFHLKSHLGPHERTQPAEGPKPPRNCPICDKPIKIGDNLRKHTDSHKGLHEITRINCPKEGCDKTLKTRNQLCRHLRSVHTSDTTKKQIFTCFECSLTFLDKATYFKHKKGHAKEKLKANKPYVCNICHARFITRVEFEYHHRNHGPAEAYVMQCPFCPQLFAKSKQLNPHKAKHHGVRVDKTKPKRAEATLQDNPKSRKPQHKRITRSQTTLMDRIIHMESSESEGEELQDPFTDIPDASYDNRRIFRNVLTSDEEDDSEEEHTSTMEEDDNEEFDQTHLEEDTSEDSSSFTFMEEDEIKEEDEDYS